jgi:hypothetical protein
MIRPLVPLAACLRRVAPALAMGVVPLLIGASCTRERASAPMPATGSVASGGAGSSAGEGPESGAAATGLAGSQAAAATQASSDPPARIDAGARASTSFADWLRARMPTGGSVEGEGAPAVVHTAAAGDTPQTIAKAYLDLTDVYRARDLAAILARTLGVEPGTPLPAGKRVTIPHLLAGPYKSAEDDRLPWPEGRALKGVFITGAFAGQFWPETVDKIADHGMNAVVLDAKDYMGPINYPTHVKLALEIGAAADPPIPDFTRAIRFAHARGIRVVARVPCFHDPFAAKHAPRLSLMSHSGKPFEMGWLDPANPEAQDYAIAMADEAASLGADEIQLDYVRFPVQSINIKNAEMPPPDGHRSQAIKAFVRRMHEVVAAHHIPLSLDVFGVTATGSISDIEALGQNLGVIGPEAEALSPMVYPSHYAPGWNGFDVPGNHAEIIGIGTRGAVERLRAGHPSHTIIRPWLQAASFKSPAFGPQYIKDEIRSAESSGAVGWLMWDPTNSYWAVWAALPVTAHAATADGRH